MLIDEIGASANMARLRDTAPRGQCCRAPIPHNHGHTATFVSAIRLEGMTAPMVLDRAMNGHASLAYVDQLLVPTLTPDDILIMGKLPAQNLAALRAAIEPEGAELCFVPPYSRLQLHRNGVKFNLPSGNLKHLCVQISNY